MSDTLVKDQSRFLRALRNPDTYLISGIVAVFGSLIGMYAAAELGNPTAKEWAREIHQTFGTDDKARAAQERAAWDGKAPANCDELHLDIPVEISPDKPLVLVFSKEQIRNNIGRGCRVAQP